MAMSSANYWRKNSHKKARKGTIKVRPITEIGFIFLVSFCAFLWRLIDGGTRMLSRRELLRRSPSALLAAGLWPGTLAAGDPETKSFSFLVVNDLHSLDKKCHTWFEKTVKQMAGHDDNPVLL